jgi:DNA-binding transcriptional regulator LsrR (DeoR family)
MTSHQPEEKEASFIMHNISNDRLVTIVARMYHEQQRTQQEIAD